MSFEDKLRYELERAGVTLPMVGIDFDQTVTRGRRLRNRSMLVAGAAAAVVTALVVAGGVVLTRSSDLAPRPQPPVGNTSSPGEEPTRTPEEKTSFDEVEPVLRAWLRAIQDGDEDSAWSLMTAEAQGVIGRAEFDELMASALPEGLGGFADASDFSYVVVSEDEDAEVVATVSGEVTREATTEYAAMAIPMVVRDGGALVNDPIIDRARYYERVAVFASASAGPFEFRAGDELIVEFAQPEGATGAVIAVDDDRRPLPTIFDPATGEATATLDHDLDAGRHIATVVVIHRSGRIYPEAIVFEAEAPS